MSPIAFLLLAVALILVLDASFTIYLSLYSWSNPDRFRQRRAPDHTAEPRLSFTLLIPARDEAAVIGDTLHQVAALEYPRHLFETVVICEAHDDLTIAAVERACRQLMGHPIRLVTFADLPINKPHALNVGLGEAHGNVIGVFDAEDEPDPGILNIVNTVMSEENVRVVQAGVQLMNLDSRWYSPLNILEYFFWFKSRLHFFSRHQVLPLGGNTVFFDRSILVGLGGWNERCLTEDAEIGMRLCAARQPIRIVYEDRRVTREESPPTVGALLRQRTRWSQGFLQIVTGGQWRGIAGWRRRGLALYTLLYPLFQAATLLMLPLALLAALYLRVPTPIAMMTILPVYLTAFLCLIEAVGLWEFAAAHDRPRPWRQIVCLPLLYMPYNWILGLAAVRAVVRHVQGIRTWEKTPHVGAHRIPVLPYLEPVLGSGGGAAPVMLAPRPIPESVGAATASSGSDVALAAGALSSPPEVLNPAPLSLPEPVTAGGGMSAAALGSATFLAPGEAPEKSSIEVLRDS